MLKAIIIGATSGIGQGLAESLAQAGYELGLTGRRKGRLLELKTALNAKIQVMDVSQHEQARKQLTALIEELGGLDLLIVNAGVSHRRANWDQELDILDINVHGFAAMTQAGLDYFIKQGHGHLVGISSISGIRGRANNISYSASKAFVSNYLQGCRQEVYHRKLPITVTDIIPGYIATDIIRGHNELFWVAPLPKAIQQMIQAIKKKKSRAYITRRWQLVAYFLTWIPDWLHQKL